PGLRQRLRYVDTKTGYSNMPAHPQAHGIFERIAEMIERIAEVVEGGHTEIAWQPPLDLDSAGDQIATADAVAGTVLGREFIQAEAAHAAVAAGEEALRRRQVLEVALQPARAELTAQTQAPQFG